jgi:hypothetical protein
MELSISSIYIAVAWNGIGILLNNRRTGLGFLRNNFVPFFRVYNEHNCFPAYLQRHIYLS